MSLTDNERTTVVRREMEKARNTFSDMELCAKEERWEAAANRLYYALFHAVTALLVSDGHLLKSHRGMMSLFGQHYVRTAIFSRAEGSLLSDLVIMRDNADYNCFFEADEDKIAPMIKPTQQLIERIKEYIENHHHSLLPIKINKQETDSTEE